MALLHKLLQGFGTALAYGLALAPALAQTDTAASPARAGLRQSYREQAYKVLIGGHLQQAEDTAGKEFSRKYLEMGFHKTTTVTYGHHPAAAITHGLSLEIAPGRQTIVGFKYGAWGVFSLLVMGLNGVYYTDFGKGNFKIRPEIGFGAHPFKLTFGYNIPTIENAAFRELRRADGQVSLAILLKARTIKKETW